MTDEPMVCQGCGYEIWGFRGPLPARPGREVTFHPECLRAHALEEAAQYAMVARHGLLVGGALEEAKVAADVSRAFSALAAALVAFDPVDYGIALRGINS